MALIRVASRRLMTAAAFAALLSGLVFSAPRAEAAKSRGLLPVAVTTQAGQRLQLYQGSFALLIGVSDYTAGWPKLESIPEELDKLQTALEKQGFSVTRVMNPGRAALQSAFERFIDAHGYDPENRLLFFYSGHGYTRRTGGRRKGYLVPADAPNPLKDPKAFNRAALTMAQVQTWAREIEAKHALFLFDSCFSGTIFKTRALPVPRHISDKTARPVRQFITAGSAGEEVPAESVFLPSFIRAIEGEGDLNGDGYVTGTELGQYLHEKVLEYDKGQTPQYGKIQDPALDEGDFVFPLAPSARRRTANVAFSEKPAGPPPGLDEDEEFWKLVRNSDNVGDFRAYLEAFPAGQFARHARLKLARLEPAPAETAKPLEPAEPTAPKPGPPKRAAARRDAPARKAGDTYRDPTTGMEFKWVPGDSFSMGCGPWAGKCEADEKPVHTVRLDGFWIGKTEVTQAQWKKIMGDNPSRFKKGGEYPVEKVSWRAVQKFIKKLNAKGKAGYRLPSEAEWEYACRAGGKRREYGTRNGGISPQAANYNRAKHGTTPGGSYRANRLGLHDMSGNLWEWVRDAYSKEAYGRGDPETPIAEPAGARRVSRGGSWRNRPRDLRCTNRRQDAERYRGYALGFRLAKSG